MASLAAAVSLKPPLPSSSSSSSFPSSIAPVSTNYSKISAISFASTRNAPNICFARFAGKRAGLVVMAAAPGDLTDELIQSIKEAEEVCAGDSAGECAASWDAVEEISAAAFDKRQQAKAQSDPLETYCKDNPETDECRVYED
ncbi:hypothetical protein O6H91_12G049200 [Diphasiastrum complanatum]|nr:hypothetical protein O6H91_12G049200 [Diphasiastrum complanatum]